MLQRRKLLLKIVKGTELRALCEDARNPERGKNPLNAGRWEAGIERHIGAAGLQNAEQRRDHRQ